MDAEKPNILWIITDHALHYGHHRPGEFELHRPHFEQLCEEGVCFDRAYSVSPICTPARSSMMTGQYPSRHGQRWNTLGFPPHNRNDFATGQMLYSHYLSSAGYRNAYIGKWHCGHTRLPADYGIEGWSLPGYGAHYQCEAYGQYCKELGLGMPTALIEEHRRISEYKGKKLVLHSDVDTDWHFMDSFGVLQGPPEAHEANFVSHLSCEKLKELTQSDQSWSMVASFWGPHHPYIPSEPYASMYDPSDIPEYPSFREIYKDKPFRHFIHRDLTYLGKMDMWDWDTWSRVLARAYGQARQLDDAVGHLLDTLDETGQADNTIVVYCADHGDAAASHGGLWDKSSTCLEEVVRIPLAVRWPKGFKGGRTSNALVSNMDITATILDAACITPQKDMQSRSLLPLCLDEGDSSWPEHLVCEHNGHHDDILQRMIVTDQYKYVAALLDGDELYDLKEDPCEMTNLIHSPELEPIRRKLRSKLVDHMKSNEVMGMGSGKYTEYTPGATQLMHSLALQVSGELF
ncbi:MAG: sulfatase-like hydrolase/transferase [Desulfotignum sp.]|nr:sulfatase-like hydrolase/transferase [Desulfotignum sp.]MCF8138667.1 sulfatase-like hydrolase/transferase [Desulfotignum sp.]